MPKIGGCLLHNIKAQQSEKSNVHHDNGIAIKSFEVAERSNIVTES